MIFAQPIALQLRFLQTMKEISGEHNTTTIQLNVGLRLISFDTPCRNVPAMNCRRFSVVPDYAMVLRLLYDVLRYPLSDVRS